MFSSIQGNDEVIAKEKLEPLQGCSDLAESAHLVQFYETDEFLVRSVSNFIRTGMQAGGAGIVFATKAHRERIEDQLKADGVDMAGARASGQYVAFDAVETLSKLVADGKLKAGAFSETIDPIVKQAAECWRGVRVFGEMVAQLWAHGLHDTAINLERGWNELHETRPFLLLCAYPMEGFAHKESTNSLELVCGEHSHIIPAEGYMALGTPEDRLRAVALLQQKARILEAEIAERTQAGERLSISESRYRRLFEEARDGILMVDPATYRITDANPSMTEFLGLDAEELVGRELWDVGLFKDRESVLEALGQFGETAIPRSRHLSLKIRTGQRREAEFVSSFFHANGHKIIQCNVRDVTERKTAEEVSSHLAAIVESSHDAIISKSLEGIILSWNKGAERIFGYSAEEVIGKPINILIPRDRVEEEPTILARLQRGERVDHYETVRQTKDGRLIYVSLAISPIRDGSGKIVAASKIARDITERKQAEEQLREQAEIIETINRIGQVLSAELNLQNVVQAVTEAATELVGASFGCFVYKTPDQTETSCALSGIPAELFAQSHLPRNSELFGPTFHADGIVRISDVSADPRYGKNSPFYGISPGDLRLISYMAVPVISRSGEVLGGLFFGHPDQGVFAERDEQIVKGLAAQAAIAMDNAQLYELSQNERAKAEAANRAKDDFLATISHELRTPLNAIIGWSHMLQRGNLDEDIVSRAVATIERNAKAQAQLIEDILDVSRVISGRLRLNNERIDLASIINAAVDSVQLAADSKDINLSVVMDTSVRHTSGDSHRLQQVVWNLLSNAIKFTPAGGRVEVRLERVESDLQIRVSDTGQGISSDFLPFVFDRFHQADTSSTRRHGGLGLGLAIVRHLIELHGGSVYAESPGEGCGAIFTVRLPLVIRHERSKGPRLASEGLDADPAIAYIPPPSLAGIQVLLVDDDSDTLQILRLVLTEFNAKVQTASSVVEALEMLQWCQPDVLVSDLAMPEEDGYSLIGKLKARESNGHRPIPTVALTAYVRVEDRARALSAGFNMFVPKPVEPSELIATIASLVEPKSTTVAWGR